MYPLYNDYMLIIIKKYNLARIKKCILLPLQFHSGGMVLRKEYKNTQKLMCSKTFILYL
jgi:hypothetical protein